MGKMCLYFSEGSMECERSAAGAARVTGFLGGVGEESKCTEVEVAEEAVLEAIGSFR